MKTTTFRRQTEKAVATIVFACPWAISQLDRHTDAVVYAVRVPVLVCACMCSTSVCVCLCDMCMCVHKKNGTNARQLRTISVPMYENTDVRTVRCNVSRVLAHVFVRSAVLVHKLDLLIEHMWLGWTVCAWIMAYVNRS